MSREFRRTTTFQPRRAGLRIVSVYSSTGNKESYFRRVSAGSGLPVSMVRTRLPASLSVSTSKDAIDIEELSAFLRLSRPTTSRDEPYRTQHRFVREVGATFGREGEASGSGRGSERTRMPMQLSWPPIPKGNPFVNKARPLSIAPEEQACHERWFASIDDPARLKKAIENSVGVLSVFADAEDVPAWLNHEAEEVCRRASSASGPAPINSIVQALGSLRGSFSRQGKRLIGFARVSGDNVMVATFQEIVVHPGMRGLGLGRMMMQRLCEDIYYKGRIADIGLMCPPTAVPFLRSCGFEPDREGSFSMTFIPTDDFVKTFDQATSRTNHLALDTLPGVLRQAAQKARSKAPGTSGTRRWVNLDVPPVSESLRRD